MNNPWLGIPAADYESHMGPEGADQLAPLSAVFSQVYRAAQPARLALLGCATGNGFEHIDPLVTTRAVGVDINLQYLAVARERARHLGARLELYCSPVEKCRLEPGAFDLIHIALLFEYVAPERLVRQVATWLADGGTCSVVLQLPGEGSATAPVFDTGMASVKALASMMRLVSPDEVAALFAQYGFTRRRAWEVPLKGGRRFAVLLFGRGDPAGYPERSSK